MALLYLALPNATACDVCGGGISGNQWGVVPQFKRSSLSLQFSQQQFRTQHSMLYKDNYSREQLFSWDLSSRIYLAPRWQIMARLPIKYNQQTNKFADTYVNLLGVGDASLSANFVVFNNTLDTVEHRFKQMFSINAGLKLPTGNYQQKEESGARINPYLQTGTGSLDFFAGASYTVRHARGFGWHNEASFRYALANKYDFQFGQRLTVASRAFYWLQTSSCMLMFQGGAMYEHSKNDRDQSRYINGSGQQSLSLLAGVDVYYRRLSAGLAILPPIWQNSDNSMVRQQISLQAKVAYIF